jgi:hypothetical protein
MKILQFFQKRVMKPQRNVDLVQTGLSESHKPIHKKVSLIILNPIINQVENLRVVDVFKWNDPEQLIEIFIADLHDASFGLVNYEIVETIVESKFPKFIDGYVYTPEEFLNCWTNQKGFHNPDRIDYHELLSSYEIINKIERALIDEVWVIGYPYAGLAESIMIGSNAFWCNSNPLLNTNAAGRRAIIMGFNFERGVGEMLESYGHRSESILEYAFRKIPDRNNQNLWKCFIRFDLTNPGKAEVGNIHFAPNSLQDYDWGNQRLVLSHSKAWFDFPDLSRKPSMENCTEWGNGDIRAHHLWWFRHIPHVAGYSNGISNNWWEFITDPNLVA